jgi:hypothetical protein
MNELSEHGTLVQALELEGTTRRLAEAGRNRESTTPDRDRGAKCA